MKHLESEQNNTEKTEEQGGVSSPASKAKAKAKAKKGAMEQEEEEK